MSRQIQRTTLNWYWRLHDQRLLRYVSSGAKFQSVSLYGQPLSSYRPCWDKCMEWLQNYIDNHKVKGTPYMCYYCSRVSTFRPFPLRPQLRAILRWLYSITSERHWILWGQKYPIHCVNISEQQISISVLLYSQTFSSYRPCWDICTEWPQNGIEHSKVKMCTELCSISTPTCKSKISLRFSVIIAISNIFTIFHLPWRMADALATTALLTQPSRVYKRNAQALKSGVGIDLL